VIGCFPWHFVIGTNSSVRKDVESVNANTNIIRGHLFNPGY